MQRAGVSLRSMRFAVLPKFRVARGRPRAYLTDDQRLLIASLPEECTDSLNRCALSSRPPLEGGVATARHGRRQSSAGLGNARSQCLSAARWVVVGDGLVDVRTTGRSRQPEGTRTLHRQRGE
jgi:hypothetical protein